MWLYHAFFCDTCDQAERTFVEVGAAGGVVGSNTLLFQAQLGFHGLLIEGHPAHAKDAIRARNGTGRVQVIPEAVCRRAGATAYAGSADTAYGTSGLPAEMAQSYTRSFRARPWTNFTVPCRPLRDMLQLASMTSIDLLSLDVEGAELLVLQTFDFATVPVRVWVVKLPGANQKRDDTIRELCHRRARTALDRPASHTDRLPLLCRCCVSASARLAAHGYAPFIPNRALQDDAAKSMAPRLHFGWRPGSEAFVHRSLVAGLEARRRQCSRCPVRHFRPWGHGQKARG